MSAIRVTAMVAALALFASCSIRLCSAKAENLSPLAASDYTARHVCAAAAPGKARCLGLELVGGPTKQMAAHTFRQARTSESRFLGAAQGGYGLRPEDLQSAYFPGRPPETPQSAAPQTVAVVNAYNDPYAESALAVYDKEFSLPECTQANGCLQQVNQNGEDTYLPFPADRGALEVTEAICKQGSSGEGETQEAACGEVEEVDAWALESSSDIEVVHGLCQNCRIRLVEAGSSEFADLQQAEQTAARAQSEGGVGANEISDSWGIGAPPVDSEAFNHPGIVIVAAAGDYGYLNWTEAEQATAHKETYYSGVEYPASSPHVIAVGATKLTLTASGARQSETVWNEGTGLAPEHNRADGGGCSLNFKAQIWQREVPDWASVGCGTGSESRRAVADVSADGDPFTGMAIYDKQPDGSEGWKTFGGTSLSSLIITSMFALAGGAHGVSYPAQTLYAHLGGGGLYDVLGPGNGICDGNYSSGCAGSMNPSSPLDCGQGVLVCNAGPGYDGPSGVGSPNGLTAFGLDSAGESDGNAPEDEGDHDSGSAVSGLPDAEGQTSPHDGITNRHTSLAKKAPPPRVLISGLALTATATYALAHGLPAVSVVAFAFRLSSPARVRIALAKRVLRGGHWHWQVLRDSLATTGRQGPNHLHLGARGRLAPGPYRLTLRPLHGRARSLSFRVG